VATHGNGFGAHCKEGVDGSSPSEGFTFPLLSASFPDLLARRVRATSTERSRDRDFSLRRSLLYELFIDGTVYVGGYDAASLIGALTTGLHD
jgi:hypothetical protein